MLIKRSAKIHIPFFRPVYKFENVPDGFPSESVMNRWAYLYGAVIKTRGIYLGAVVQEWSLNGDEPLVVQPILSQGFRTKPLGSSSPTTDEVLADIIGTRLPVSECEEFYYFLPLGQSIKSYINHAIPLLEETYRKIKQGTKRSLAKAIITADRRIRPELKREVNSMERGEIAILDKVALNESPIEVIAIPDSTDAIRNLWQSYDLSKQEYLLLLGISYNPEKRERLLVDEIGEHAQEIEVIRDYLLDCANRSANKYGVKVRHIAEVVQERRDIRRMEMQYHQSIAGGMGANVMGATDANNVESLQISDRGVINDETV